MGLEEIVRGQTLLCIKKDRKLWKAITTDVLKQQKETLNSLLNDFMQIGNNRDWNK